MAKLDAFIRKKANRREFIQESIAWGGTLYASSLLWGTGSAFAADAEPGIPDLVAVRNGEPDMMFDKAIAAMGGMGAFVKPGQTVAIKPNIGWNRGPESGANTNPLLVKRIIEHARQAGAKKVYVFDNTVSSPRSSYKNSGIEEAAKLGGASLVPGNKERYYQKIEIPQASLLKTTKAHEMFLEADVLINVPVLKHHASTKLTIAMKNLMGVVWDCRWYHDNGLHQSIADFCLYRKPTLNVVDAYRMTMNHGPSRARAEDVVLKKSLLLSTDMVCVDAAAAKLFGLAPEQVRYIALAHEKRIGNMNLQGRKIQKFVI